jgi:hypothetical protein
MATVLSGCSATEFTQPAGKYKDFSDYTYQTSLENIGKNHPELPMDVRERWATCFTTFAMEQIPPDELALLDPAARGETVEKTGKIVFANVRIQNAYSKASKWERDSLAPLMKYCPQTVGEVRRLAKVKHIYTYYN